MLCSSWLGVCAQLCPACRRGPAGRGSGAGCPLCLMGPLFLPPGAVLRLRRCPVAWPCCGESWTRDGNSKVTFWPLGGMGCGAFLFFFSTYFFFFCCYFIYICCLLLVLLLAGLLSWTNAIRWADLFGLSRSRPFRGYGYPQQQSFQLTCSAWPPRPSHCSPLVGVEIHCISANPNNTWMPCIVTLTAPHAETPWQACNPGFASALSFRRIVRVINGDTTVKVLSLG